VCAYIVNLIPFVITDTNDVPAWKFNMDGEFNLDFDYRSITSHNNSGDPLFIWHWLGTKRIRIFF